ncbi:hypothetical protein JT358_15405 [Micrococcales bacterium 31B]|nr:hypothetical protein [Micrococcales bacterium 31B]
MIKKYLPATVSVLALTMNLLVAPPAMAIDTNPGESDTAIVQAEYKGLAPSEIVEQGLAEEGLDVEQVAVDAGGIEIAAETTDPEGNFAFDLALEPGQPHGVVTFTDTVAGETVTESYEIEILESQVERSVFVLTNPETGEKYTYDSAAASTSIVFVIPVAFAAISISTAFYYLAVGAAIVIAGALALEAAKAVSSIIAENNRRPSSQKRSYYPAVRSGSKVFISPNGLSSAQAQTRGRAGLDVWAISRESAKSLAKTLNPSGTPIGAEKHGAGYLWHFHPAAHRPNMHSFYGLPA